MAVAGELSTDSGYFRFGTNVCYGQSSCGSRSPEIADVLYDTAPAARACAGVLRVPFDPSQVVDNFRMERYTPDPAGPRRSPPELVAEEALLLCSTGRKRLWPCRRRCGGGRCSRDHRRRGERPALRA